jgi:hypothetical protein
MIERRRTLASVAIFAAVVFALVGTVLSSSTSAVQVAQVGGNALRISPVRTDLTIEPGSARAVEVTVQNMSGASATLRPIVNDFTVRPDNETGQPDIILDDKQASPQHGLKQYISPLADFTLGPNEQRNIKVIITIPKAAAGGGYYGAVRFQPASAGSSQVSLSGSVGSLILVRVPGDVIEKVSLASFDVRQKGSVGSFFTSSADLAAVARFKNEGNVQVQPFGKITLKNQSGKVVASYEVNNTEPRGNVLPDSIRRFDTALTKAGSIGKFTLEGNFGYGSSGQLISTSKTFYVIPAWLMITVAVVIILVILGVFVIPRLLRAYNQRIIRNATRRR